MSIMLAHTSTKIAALRDRAFVRRAETTAAACIPYPRSLNHATVSSIGMAKGAYLQVKGSRKWAQEV